MNSLRSDGKPAHVWKTGGELGMPAHSRLYTMDVCKNCGVLRGLPNHPETACKGTIQVTLRSMNHANIDPS